MSTHSETFILDSAQMMHVYRYLDKDYHAGGWVYHPQGKDILWVHAKRKDEILIVNGNADVASEHDATPVIITYAVADAEPLWP